MLISIKPILLSAAFFCSIVYSARAGDQGAYGPLLLASMLVAVLVLHLTYLKKVSAIVVFLFFLIAGAAIGGLTSEVLSTNRIINSVAAMLTGYVIALLSQPVQETQGLDLVRLWSCIAVAICLFAFIDPDPSQSGLWTSIFSKPNNFALFLTTTSCLVYVGNTGGNQLTLFIMLLLAVLSFKVGSRAATACILILMVAHGFRSYGAISKYIFLLCLIFVGGFIALESGLLSAFEAKIERRGGLLETSRVMIWSYYLPYLKWFGASDQGIDEGLHSSWLWLTFHLGIIPGICLCLMIIARLYRFFTTVAFDRLEAFVFLTVVFLSATLEVIFFKPFNIFLVLLLSVAPRGHGLLRSTRVSAPQKRVEYVRR